MKRKRKGLLGLLLAVAMGLTACGGGTADFTDEAVLKVNGQEVMKSEYMVYLYTTTQSFVSAAGEDVWSMDFDGMTADELVEERTIMTVQSVAAAREYAQANGIALTEEQQEEAKLAAESFVASVSREDLAKMGIDAEKVQPLMEDSYLFSLVYEAISKECEVDEGELNSFFEENKAGLMEEFQLLTVNSIVVNDLETAEEVREKAQAGEDFSALFDAYDVVGNVEGEGEDGEMTVYRYYLESEFGLSADAAVGDVEGPFQMGETYFILKVAAEKAPEEAEVKEMAAESYRVNMQSLYAEERMAELAAGQSVEKIEGVFETLEKFH